MPRVFDVLIVGCGRIAGNTADSGLETHVGASRATGRFRLAACVDTDIARATRFATAHGGRPFCDFSRALESQRFDLVVISSPNETHYPLTRELLPILDEAQMIFLEKPAVTNLREMKDLSSLLANSRTNLFINHTRRFDSRFLWLRDQILEEKWGKLLRLNATYYGGWLNNGSHLVDIINMLTGKTLVLGGFLGRVEGYGAADPSLEFRASIPDMGAEVRISAIEITAYQLFEFDFWFDRGRFRVESFGDSSWLEVALEDDYGDMVLSPMDTEFAEKPAQPMLTAYGEIAMVLDGGTSPLLESCSWEQAGPTMSTLFKGREMFSGEESRID